MVIKVEDTGAKHEYKASLKKLAKNKLTSLFVQIVNDREIFL
jgi:hypothetical protein